MTIKTHPHTAFLESWKTYINDVLRYEGMTISLSNDDLVAYRSDFVRRQRGDEPEYVKLSEYTEPDNNVRLVNISGNLFVLLVCAKYHTIWLPLDAKVVDNTVYLPEEIM